MKATDPFFDFETFWKRGWWPDFHSFHIVNKYPCAYNIHKDQKTSNGATQRFFFKCEVGTQDANRRNCIESTAQVDCDDNLQRRNEITNGIKMYIFLKVSCCEMCGCARAHGKRKLNSNRRGRGLGMLKKSEDPKALCGCPYEIDDERLLRSFVVFFNHFSFLILFSNTFPCERYWGVFFYWVI